MKTNGDWILGLCLYQGLGGWSIALKMPLFTDYGVVAVYSLLLLARFSQNRNLLYFGIC